MKKKLLIFMTALALIITGIGFSYEYGDNVAEKDYIVMVSHSEYWSGEEGQIIGKLYDFQGDPVIVDNCTIDIYYPDKSLFINDGITDDSLQSTTGTHWYNFTTPSIEGVYEYSIQCSYQPNKVRSVSNSFHLSPALNLVGELQLNLTTLMNSESLHYNSVINNITAVKDDTDWLRANVLTDTNARNNFTAILSNQNTMLSDLSDIKNFCDDSTTNTSTLCQLVYETRDRLLNINQTLSYEFAQTNAYLYEINQTTQNTYAYMTGTLATNINNIISQLTRVEDNTLAINQTTNTIRNDTKTIVDNQEKVVYFDVMS
jgi:methyl-accepting chemotaxis protein